MIGSDRRASSCPGFSLTEMLVVLMLFSTAILILSQTYLSFMRLSRKTANAVAVQQDMRFVLEYLVRAVRNTPIDYRSDWSSATSTLRLGETDGPKTVVMRSVPGDARCLDASGAACLLVSPDAGATWTPLTAKGVNVDDFLVVVRPAVSPFEPSGSLYASNQQPFATIRLKLTALAANPRERISLDAQTTVSSRQYAR